MYVDAEENREGVAVPVLLMMAGVAFAVLTSAVNHGFGGSASNYASKIIGSGWIWLSVGFAACLLGRRWKESTFNGLAFYQPAMVAYCLSDAFAGVWSNTSGDQAKSQFDLAGFVMELGFYLFLGGVASAVLGLIVVSIHKKGILGFLATIAVPAYVAGNALWLHFQLKASSFYFDPMLIKASGQVGVCAVIVLVFLILRTILQQAVRVIRSS